MRTCEIRTCREDAGYSIVELLVVLVVLAASAMIVGPRVSESRDAITVNAAGHRLAAALARTRAGSIADSAPRDFVLDLDKRGFGPDRNKTLKQLAPGIALTVSGFLSEPGGRRMRVRFMPDGRATGGAIILRKSKSAVSVAVDWLTGVVRVRRLG